MLFKIMKPDLCVSRIEIRYATLEIALYLLSWENDLDGISSICIGQMTVCKDSALFTWTYRNIKSHLKLRFVNVELSILMHNS